MPLTAQVTLDCPMHLPEASSARQARLPAVPVANSAARHSDPIVKQILESIQH